MKGTTPVARAVSTLLVYLLTGGSLPLFAEEDSEEYKYGVPPLDPDTYEIFDRRELDLPPSASIDPSFLDEMQYEYARCQLNPEKFGAEDCGCRAMGYLKARIAMPEVRKHEVVAEAEKSSCLVPRKVRDQMTGDCMNVRGMNRFSQAQVNDFHACCSQKIGDEHVARYIETGYRGKLGSYLRQARSECRESLE